MADATFIIAENNVLYRLGLTSIINDHIQSPTIYFVSTKNELRKALLFRSEAVVIIDFDSLAIDHLDEVIFLSVSFPKSRWLFVSDFAEESFLLPLAFSFGEANFILKSNEYDIISKAIISTVSGEKFYCREALQIIMGNHTRKRVSSLKRNLLTATELELLQLFAQGKTAREIAEIRSLSHHTVNTHRKNVFRKLEVNNIQELIKYALKHGLVDLTEYYI